MIRETTYCDRCGKVVEGGTHKRGLYIFCKKYLVKVNRASDYLDLCGSCQESLKNWMESGKREQNN